MYKGYTNRIPTFHNNYTNIGTLAHINKCTRCKRFNPSLHSPALNNIQNCLFCGNPFYIVKQQK